MAGNFFAEWLWRRPAALLGFQKRYNWPLFFIFAGALVGFSLARLQYLSPSIYATSSSPGEWYWQRAGHYRVGLYLHLGAILPAGLLLIWQFVPAIRHRAIIFHRINGYLVITLIMISHVGALMMVRRSFGGNLGFQSTMGLAVILTTTAIVLAVYNIKKLQIDQHRAWMLRAMVYIAFMLVISLFPNPICPPKLTTRLPSITFRIIMIISAVIISAIGSYNTTMLCGEVAFINRDGANSTYMALQYPSCTNSDASQPVIVHANLSGPSGENAGASLRMSSGLAAFLALALHVIGVEIYLRLTPREGERLRQVSATRQMEAGYKQPGSAGLVVQRFGDAEPWIMRGKEVSADEAAAMKARNASANGDLSA
ncbi:uncharacterized protein AB675_11493 [Cyphellophora attinorum]|uniref:DUF2306 domain-containing protein n=1 Tax=Cyphellophora attinorum TaxID=1664694 RepID=A0A0N0NMA1_9EURO|nr:uncharacterized protein AB675_11493 [Phialophora attinorum]KPI40108.1 hypothetical protein AB675_11493 [Phialophora attinorum]